MKKKTKAISILLTGVALAIGIAISNAVIQNSFVLDETKAAPNDQIAKFDADIVVSDSGYKKYEDTNWLLTFGGNQSSAGTNSAQYDNCKLGSTYVKYAGDSGITSSNVAYAIATKITIGKIGKVVFAYSGGKNTRGTVFLTSSSDGTSYSKIALNTGTGLSQQGSTVSSSMTFEFSMISSATYYALVVKDSGAKSDWRFDGVTATFYEGAPLKQLQFISVITPPSKTSYFVGESINTNGLLIRASYDVGDPVDVTSSCSFSPSSFSEAGSNISVTASYTEESVTKTTSIEGISVTARNLVSIAVTTNPSKMAYLVGETFSPAGMVITATYDEGDPVNSYTNYTYSPTTAFVSSGTKVITITSSDDILITALIEVQVSDAPSITELFISEYVEGSGNNKAIEIYNGTGSAISLASYSIKIFSNGASSANNTLSLSGTIANNDVYITANSSASLEVISSVADNTNVTVTAFNGDDAIGLYKNGTLIDLIGIIGNDPGTAWTGTAANGAGSTEDRTLVRVSSITSPNATFTWLEWNAYAIDTVAYLGSHTITSAPTQAQLDAVAYGTSFLSATASGCSAASSSELSGVWSSLESSYNALSSDAKAYLTSLTPNASGNDAEHAVARYIHIITKYGEATFVDFMNLDIQAAPTTSNLLDINSSDFLPLISVIGIIGLTIIIGYYYHNKKKEA